MFLANLYFALWIHTIHMTQKPTCSKMKIHKNNDKFIQLDELPFHKTDSKICNIVYHVFKKRLIFYSIQNYTSFQVSGRNYTSIVTLTSFNLEIYLYSFLYIKNVNYQYKLSHKILYSFFKVIILIVKLLIFVMYIIQYMLQKMLITLREQLIIIIFGHIQVK